MVDRQRRASNGGTDLQHPITNIRYPSSPSFAFQSPGSAGFLRDVQKLVLIVGILLVIFTLFAAFKDRIFK